MGDIRTERRFRIEAKFADRVLLPANAIEQGLFESGSQKSYPVTTVDGKDCLMQFESAWRNEDGRYDEQLDFICQKNWQMPFPSLRSIWIGRLGQIENFWYLVSMEQV